MCVCVCVCSLTIWKELRRALSHNIFHWLYTSHWERSVTTNVQKHISTGDEDVNVIIILKWKNKTYCRLPSRTEHLYYFLYYFYDPKTIIIINETSFHFYRPVSLPPTKIFKKK